MAHPGYCTQDDLEDRYRSENLTALADYDGDGAADSDTVAKAIGDASHEIDSYLQVKYAVPITPAPDCLRRCATTMAWYYLRLGRESVTEDAQKAYDRCIKMLEGIAAGEIGIGVDPLPAESSGAATVHSSAQDRLFGRDKPL